MKKILRACDLKMPRANSTQNTVFESFQFVQLIIIIKIIYKF